MEWKQTFAAEDGTVRCLRFAPDGATFLAGRDTGAVTRVDAKTGATLEALGRHTGAVQSLSLSPDGKLVASAGAEGEVHLRRLADGERVLRLEGHTRACFSPGGHHLATLASDGHVHLFDADELRTLRVVPPLDRRPGGLAFAPRAGTLFVAGSGSIHPITLPDGTLEEPLRGHQIAVTDLALSPNQSLLASAGTDGRLCFWTVVGGSLVTSIELGDRGEPRLAFLPDGRSLLVSTASKLARLSVPDGGNRGSALLEQPGIVALELAPDGQGALCALADGTLRVLSLV